MSFFVYSVYYLQFCNTLVAFYALYNYVMCMRTSNFLLPFHIQNVKWFSTMGLRIIDCIASSFKLKLSWVAVPKKKNKNFIIFSTLLHQRITSTNAFIVTMEQSFQICNCDVATPIIIYLRNEIQTFEVIHVNIL